MIEWTYSTSSPVKIVRYISNYSGDKPDIIAGLDDGFVYRVKGAAKSPSSITCSPSATSVVTGRNILISGFISPARGGVTVTLSYIRPDGSTITKTVTSKSDGSYVDNFVPDQIGTWQVKASWGGDEIYNAAESQTTSFTVTATPPPTQTISLSSKTTDGRTNVGTLIIAGETLNLPKSLEKAVGEYSITAIPPSGYVFDRWETSGGISVSDAMSQTTTMEVGGSGELKAVFKLSSQPSGPSPEPEPGPSLPDAHTILLYFPTIMVWPLCAAIIYGMLREIRIFGDGGALNAIIAISMASIASLGTYRAISILYSIGAAFAAMAFLFIFIIGVYVFMRRYILKSKAGD
jgi:hypothetical protein